MNDISVVLPDGSLNLAFLEKDVSRDMVTHKKHNSEDEMKKRAIHTSANYDEFKAFVKCSQLTPIGSSEVRQLLQPASGVTKKSKLNKVVSKHDFSIHMPSPLKASEIHMKKTDNKENACNYIPLNALEFERVWKIQHTTLHNKSQFLLYVMSPKTVAKLYSKLEMNFVLLAEILETLYYICNNISSFTKERKPDSTEIDRKVIYKWIKMCTKTSRFSINVNFLSDEQKCMVEFMISQFLKEIPNSTPIPEEALEGLRSKFCL